jgi:uncharacterized protein (UPF0335 family)
MGRNGAGATGPKIGDNSNLNADEKLKLSGFMSEIERLEAQKRILAEDISEIYKGAKDAGFNTKAMRHNVKMRRMDREERSAFENACEAYTLAMGDFATTDLGRASAPQHADA